jgi:hypothetical protein
MAMCDCYYHHCECCDQPYPVHLGDFDTDRNEIKIWCKQCWEKANRPKHWTRFAIKITDYNMGYLDLDKIPQTEMTIGYITDNAICNREHNHPNCSSVKQLETEVGLNEQNII